MKKEVLVTIRGMQFTKQEEGDLEPIEVIMAGDYYKKNNNHYVIYDEIIEGFDGTTKNIIKLQQNCVDIIKKGVANVHMTFEKNKKNVTCYDTPYGSLMLGINAKKIDIQEKEDDISVRVDYALELNYEHLANCNIKMAIRSRESRDFHICS